MADEARLQRSDDVRRKMRLGVFTTYVHHRSGDAVYAERAFAVFLDALQARFDGLTVFGRLSPNGGPARYPIGDDVEFIPLPFYPDLSRPLEALPSLFRSLTLFWSSLPSLDVVWLLGPHPLAIAFAGLARLRRTRVVLGVRQDLPAYVSNRHPRRPVLRAAASVLEGAFRTMGRRLPVVVVGPELARKYGRSRTLLEIAVSLVRAEDVIEPDLALARSYGGELQLLAVGRLEAEKNPLLLADVLALLNSDQPRWRLVVCGDGELSESLQSRLVEKGQAARAELRGYVPFGDELNAVYRGSHVLLHNSWTEGLPQVLLEAMAAGLPVVASDVGGIRDAVGSAAVLVTPGDPTGAAQAVEALTNNAAARTDLVRAGSRYVHAHTIEAETKRVAEFLRDPE